MEKIWQIVPKIENRYARMYPQYDELILQLLISRGLIEKPDIDDFLNPDFAKHSHDPFRFKEMDKAVEIIIKHIKEGNLIFVYGDYDADGVTSSALMMEVLTTLKAKTDIRIPHRVTEGYGINQEALKEIIDAGAKLIITVDNGIRNKEEVSIAQTAGLEVVICDHHPAPPDKADWPETVIINSVLPDETYPDKNLAGVGVAFKLAQALIKRSTLSEEDKIKLERRLLDLVVIGTVADCVSVLGENRTLIIEGLKELNQTKRIGLKELIEIAKLNSNRQMDTWNVGFQIAPRLNAAGRMGSANSAYELLLAKDKNEARNLAMRLNKRNLDRQKQTDDIFNAVEEQIDKYSDNKIIIGICPENKSDSEDDWNEGVIGLVAGKITQKYNLPSLVITKAEEGYKGSGRSIPELNLAEAVEECSDLLNRYGGHPAACGFSLSSNHLEDFRQKITGIVNKKLEGVELKPKIKIDAEIPLVSVNEEFINSINMLAPFGQKNERPKFVSYNVTVMDIVHMGLESQHIKLRLKSEDSSVISAIGFGQAEELDYLTVSDKIDIVYFVELNEFNSRVTPQLKIIDIKPSTNDE